MAQTNVSDVAGDADQRNWINNNDQSSAQAITLTELAAAIQVDEDTLLERLAVILTKRENDTGPDAAKG